MDSPDIRQNPREPFTDASRNKISILMLTIKWLFDTFGFPSINKSLVNNLRLVDPEANNINITCSVLGEEEQIPDNQLEDANKHLVELRAAKQPRGKKKKPELSWLNEQSILYYHHLIFEKKHDFIIGHMPYLVDGCLNLRDLSKQIHEGQGHCPKIILVAHALPLTVDGDVDEECLTEWLQEADIVLSVGNTIWMKIDSHIMANDISIEHKLYIPGFPLDFFQIESNPRKKTLIGEQGILLMANEIENLALSGLHFELAVVSSSQASENILFSEGADLSKQLSFSLKLIASNDKEKDLWEKMFSETKDKSKIETRAPIFRFCAPSDIGKLLPHLKKGTLLILPLKPDSSIFGVEALVAMASGVPILVSSISGVASFLQGMGMDEPIVNDDGGFSKDVQAWKERLINKVTNPEEAQNIAAKLRKMLLLDTRIATTHLDFIQTITSKCTLQQVQVERHQPIPDKYYTKTFN